MGCFEFVRPPCAGDATGDFDVDITDLLLTLSAFGDVGANLASDFDGDGDVDIDDLLIVLGVFGTDCTAG